MLKYAQAITIRNETEARTIFQVRLKELRETAGYSQYTLADVLGVSQSAVGNWEAGAREPNLDTVQRLASFFDVSVDYLIGKDPIAERKKESSDNDVSEDPKVALFGGDVIVTDAMWEEAKAYARLIAVRESAKEK